MKEIREGKRDDVLEEYEKRREGEEGEGEERERERRGRERRGKGERWEGTGEGGLRTMRYDISQEVRQQNESTREVRRGERGRQKGRDSIPEL